MNGKDIFLGLKYVGEDLVEEAEYGSFSAKEKKKDSGLRTLSRRPFLIAALIGLMLFLMGCAWVVMQMRDWVMGEVQESYDSYDYDTMEYLGKETVTKQVLTLAGLKGTSGYQAAMEWFTFKQNYDPNHVIQFELIEKGLTPEYPAEYDSYLIYTQEMKDTLDGIFKKYGLKPEGAALEFRTVRNLCDALGVEKIHTSANDIEIRVTGGQYRENGNFNMNLQIALPEEENAFGSTWGVLHWNRKDCLTEDYITIEDTGDWQEWNYTTTSGSDVLIIRSPSDWRGWILCDREEAVLAVQLEVRKDLWNQEDGNAGADYVYMTDRQLEQVADAIDFGIRPEKPTREDVENQPAVPAEATQDGYTVEVKKVETDGCIAYITIGITAPEGVDIVHNPHPGYEDRPYHILPCGFPDLVPAKGEMGSGSGGWNPVEDGDGLDNTQDFVIEANYDMVDGSDPFAPGTQWNLHIEDLIHSYYDQEKNESVEIVLAEGEWLFPITFSEENGDYREIQLTPEPVSVKGSVGWKPDGTDVLEEVQITSFVLRRYGADIVCDNENACFDFINGQSLTVVMKDGTEILLLSGSHYFALAPIDLDQVDHVRLPDGTKLNVPETE